MRRSSGNRKNLRYMRDGTDSDEAVLMAIDLLASRGIPMVLFIARLRGLKVEVGPVILQHIDAILDAYSKDRIIDVLNRLDQANRPIAIGRHEDVD